MIEEHQKKHRKHYFPEHRILFCVLPIYRRSIPRPHTSNINGGGTRTHTTQRTFQLEEVILVLTQAPSYLDRASMLVIIGKH